MLHEGKSVLMNQPILVVVDIAHWAAELDIENKDISLWFFDSK